MCRVNTADTAMFSHRRLVDSADLSMRKPAATTEAGVPQPGLWQRVMAKAQHSCLNAG
jgi:hypothetical protein